MRNFLYDCSTFTRKCVPNAVNSTAVIFSSVSSSGEEVKDDFVVVVVSTFEKVTTSNAFREDFAGDSNAFVTVENNDAKTNKRTEKTTPLLSTKNRFCCRIIIVFIVDKKRTSRLSASLSRALFVLRSYEEYCVCVVLLCGTPNTNKYVTT